MSVWEIPIDEETIRWAQREKTESQQRAFLARARTSWLKDDLVDHLRGQGFNAWTEIPCVGGMIGSAEGRMDVWAIKPTYGERYTACYEVKVTRTDFLNDRNSGKYEKYRPFARRFYYAVPSGLVKLAEVPEGVGLVVRSERGWRHLRHPIPNESYEPSIEFILMLLRRGLGEEREVRDLRMRATWEEGVALSFQAHRLGHEIARRLREAEAGGVGVSVEERNRQNRALALLEAVEGFMAKRGVKMERFDDDPERLVRYLGSMLANADRVRRLGGLLTRMPYTEADEWERLLREHE